MPWEVVERRDGEVHQTVTKPTQEEAIETAIQWAEANDFIREDGKGDDFMAFQSSWTRDELREQLREYGGYTDGEIEVTVEQTS